MTESKPLYQSAAQYLKRDDRLVAECVDMRTAMELRDALNQNAALLAEKEQLQQHHDYTISEHSKRRVIWQTQIEQLTQELAHRTTRGSISIQTLQREADALRTALRNVEEVLSSNGYAETYNSKALSIIRAITEAGTSPAPAPDQKCVIYASVCETCHVQVHASMWDEKCSYCGGTSKIDVGAPAPEEKA